MGMIVIISPSPTLIAAASDAQSFPLIAMYRRDGSSLYQVGRLNCNFPSLRYIISMIFFVVLKPLA
ncbi:MAG: hypothetical protein WA106_00830, partial [Methanothrix sp.]